MSIEQEVIGKAKANDQLAFNTLFNTYWDTVYAFLLSRTADPSKAEELAIETFSKAFDRIDRFDTKFSFVSWIMTIAKNHHIDNFRSSKKFAENTNQMSEEKFQEISSREPSPEDLLISNQNLDFVLSQIKSLKEDYRTILKLRYFDDLSLKQIEKKLKEPASTVRVKLFRAKKMLANKLERESH
jgi:RNA polymerase sigma factor (sigma-70 family)